MAGKKKSWKREIIEWTALLAVGIFLYTTGLHVPVIGTLQRALLWTGILQPELSAETNLGTMPYDWYLRDEQGNLYSVETVKGRVLFINFWATWCPPCVAEMPGIHDLYQSVHSDSVQFLMISMDQDRETARRFLQQHGFHFPLYFPAGPVPDVLQSSTIPTTFVIAPDGRIVVQKKGLAKYNTSRFKDFLRQLSRTPH